MSSVQYTTELRPMLLYIRGIQLQQQQTLQQQKLHCHVIIMGKECVP
jgi:hypothetical protein